MRTSFGFRGVLLACVLTGAAVCPSALRAQFHEDGWVTQWLLYGPLSQFGGAAPGEDFIRLDYLSDGIDFFEATILPDTTTSVLPDFFGASAADGFHPVLGLDDAAFEEIDTANIGAPSQFTVDFDWIYAAGVDGTIDQAIFHAFLYIKNDTGGDLEATIQVASDDSVQVLLDGSEIWIHNVGRGVGANGVGTGPGNVL